MGDRRSAVSVSRQQWLVIGGVLVIGIMTGVGIGGRGRGPVDADSPPDREVVVDFVTQVPGSSPVWSFSEKVTADETVVMKDSEGIYHLFVEGREEGGHVVRPLEWDRVVAREDFSVPLFDSPDEPGGEFRFWFGSVTRRTLDHKFVTAWFKNNGEEINMDEVKVLAEARGVDIDRWSIGGYEDELTLKLVGDFEGVRNGFIPRGAQIFIPGADAPLVARDVSFGQVDLPRHLLTVKIPGGSFENFLMTVDLAWGDRTATLSPEVGSRASISGVDAELVFLEPFAIASGGVQRGNFAECFTSQQVRVSTSTPGFFFSDPSIALFVYPEMISMTGQSEIRYFSSMVYGHGPDIRAVSVPIAMQDIERIVIHHRHRRCRAVFPLKDLPVPEIQRTDE